MQQKVKIPAIGLIVLGILGVAYGLFAIFAGGVDVAQLTEAGMSEEQAQQIAGYLGTGGKALNVLGIAMSGFVAWAGFQMLNLKGWTAAVVANILVMIPCVSGCCCIVGLPLGIWGLVVLFKGDVKAAFQGQPPAA